MGKILEKINLKPQYAYWEIDEAEPKLGYWMLFDSLEDAVSTKEDSGVEIFKLTPTYLGKFKRSVEVVRVPKNKHKKKK